MADYDEVAYPSLPLPPTQPDRIATVARLRGVRAADPAACRVLEIGCSDAGNVAWLAAHAPDSRFLGVDLSARAVARAQDAIAELPNIEVDQADLRTLAAGTFDFVIAHGVYSWLPDPSDLLACIARHLATDGVAYVSYNAMPGSALRAMAGDVLRRFAAGHPAPTIAARSLMEWVGQTRIDSAHAEMMRWAMGRAAAKPDHVLAHDELAPVTHAVYLDAFVAAAAGHGLAYLDESHVADSAPPPGLELPDWLAERVGDDEVARQQLFDYARNRAFRQTLLVRSSNAPTHPGYRVEALDGLWAACPVRRVVDAPGAPEWLVGDGIQLSGGNPGLAADLALLGEAWPGSVAAADLRLDRGLLLALHAARGLELRVHPVPAVRPGARPRVHAHVRDQAARGGIVANLRHEPVDLDRPIARELLARCDGRAGREELAAALSTSAGALDALLDELGEAAVFLA